MIDILRNFYPEKWDESLKKRQRRKKSSDITAKWNEEKKYIRPFI